jgi:hypothetical protein
MKEELRIRKEMVKSREKQMQECPLDPQLEESLQDQGEHAFPDHGALISSACSPSAPSGQSRERIHSHSA